MDVLPEAAVKFHEKLCRDLRQNLRRDRLLHRPDLDQRFFRTGLFVESEILSGSVSGRMSGLSVSLMLSFTKIIVAVSVESSLNLLKGINDPVFLFLISGEVKPLVAVPIDIPLCPFLIDVLTVRDIETAVIVLWIVSSVLAGSSIVPCQLHVVFYSHRSPSFHRKLKIMLCPCLIKTAKTGECVGR